MMRQIILSTVFILVSVVVKAEVVNSVKQEAVNSSSVKINPSEIDKVIRLVDKEVAGSSHKKVSVVVVDKGLSTDLSPRFQIFLGFASLAEMGNISADFLINDQGMKFISASRKAAGIYEVKLTEFRQEIGMVEVTQTIDATQMFKDEQGLRAQCGSDFCDQELKSTVQVTSKVRKI